MHAAVLIAGPFFVLYMIRDIHLPYWEYGAWLAAGTRHSTAQAAKAA